MKNYIQQIFWFVYFRSFNQFLVNREINIILISNNLDLSGHFASSNRIPKTKRILMSWIETAKNKFYSPRTKVKGYLRMSHTNVLIEYFKNILRSTLVLIIIFTNSLILEQVIGNMLIFYKLFFNFELWRKSDVIEFVHFEF